MSNSLEEEYDKIYIEFIDYIGRNFGPSMAESTVHAESLTNIVKQEIENAIQEAE